MVKKVVDTWKTKQWYEVVAPQIFDSKVVGEIISSDPKILKDRVVKVGLDELTGDFSQAYTNVKLRIVDVKGKTATTKFIGSEQLPSYIRTFIRRRKTLIDDVIDVKTMDGQQLRIKPIVFTGGKIARDAEAKIRTTLRALLAEKASKTNSDDLLREILFKKYAQSLIPAIKKIAPIKRIEIRKIELKEVFTK
ncbi:MAG: 30S ribosomal protein S3ae [Candidatus Micrarchaeota archaeon]|nr:30S ribosomal protein S3ae [Candidatus Micrarchaeota archaeon]